MPRPALITLSPDDPRFLALWEHSPGRSPFSHPAVVRAIAETFGLGLRLAAIEGGAGTLAAASWVFEKRRGPFVVSALPPLTPVHAPLLAAPLAEADTNARRSALDRLLADLDTEVHQAAYALPAPPGDLRPYQWAGWRVTPRATYRLDLSGDLTGGYSGSTRRIVQREADAFAVSEHARHVGDAARLMDASYRRHGNPLGVPESSVAAVGAAAVRAGQARAFAAERDGEVEASAVVATGGRASYYWIAGSRPGPAMTVLLDAVFHRLQNEGVESIDLCGANVPGIAEFKRKFGADLALAPIARRVRHPALRLAQRVLGRM